MGHPAVKRLVDETIRPVGLAVINQPWVLAYEVTDEGVIVQDMSHTAMLDDIAD